MKGLASALIALAALASPVSLQAQEPLSPDAEESLKCAIWASYFGAVLAEDAEAAGFAHALDYFVGRYEALTGEGIDQALDAVLIVATLNSIDELTPVCGARMQQYGARMIDWSKVLQDIARGMPDEAAPTS